jgi:hypothetical protein
MYRRRRNCGIGCVTTTIPYNTNTTGTTGYGNSPQSESSSYIDNDDPSYHMDSPPSYNINDAMNNNNNNVSMFPPQRQRDDDDDNDNVSNVGIVKNDWN